MIAENQCTSGNHHKIFALEFQGLQKLENSFFLFFCN